MEERVEEGKLPGAKEIVPLDKTDLKRMSKCICKLSGEKIGTGIFCKIKYNNKLIPVLITNYHVITENYLKGKTQLKFYINDNYKIININEKSTIYSSVRDKYDMFIIKLKDDEINNYLEIDSNIFNNNSENSYRDEAIYILHYPNGGEASVSYGNGIETINEYDIKHLCNTDSGSSGGPILSLLTNKVIGIHKGAITKKGEIKNNIGTFLKFPLNELNPNTPMHYAIKPGNSYNQEIIANSFCGMKNLNNTSYINSSLQILLHIQEFVKIIEDNNYSENNIIGNINTIFKKIINK